MTRWSGAVADQADLGVGKPPYIMKFLLLLAVLAIAIWYWLGQRKNPTSSADTRTPPGAAENIVVCAHCHLHVPESEAILAAGQHYCCEEHRKLGAS